MQKRQPREGLPPSRPGCRPSWVACRRTASASLWSSSSSSRCVLLSKQCKCGDCQLSSFGKGADWREMGAVRQTTDLPHGVEELNNRWMCLWLGHEHACGVTCWCLHNMHPDQDPEAAVVPAQLAASAQHTVSVLQGFGQWPQLLSPAMELCRSLKQQLLAFGDGHSSIAALSSEQGG